MFNIIALIEGNNSENTNVIQQSKQIHFFHLFLNLSLNKDQRGSFYHCWNHVNLLTYSSLTLDKTLVDIQNILMKINCKCNNNSLIY